MAHRDAHLAWATAFAVVGVTLIVAYVGGKEGLTALGGIALFVVFCKAMM